MFIETNPTGDQPSSEHSMVGATINPFQRALLAANGTVTAMLEAYFSEPIHIIKLSEELIETPQHRLNLLQPGERVIARKVLLRGRNSCRNFVYAESLILIDNLESEFSHELLTTQKPIGQLWVEHKVETFKDIIESGEKMARSLSAYFHISPDAPLLFRTYSVSSKGKVIMIITETFPERYSFEHLPLVS